MPRKLNAAGGGPKPTINAEGANYNKEGYYGKIQTVVKIGCN